MPSSEKEIFKFAFGSCNNQRLDQSHWDNISDHKPDLWLWLGDTIYADNTDASQRWGEYKSLLDNPFYNDFSSQTWVTGIWDDHDFDSNGTGGSGRDTSSTEKVFLDFLGEPVDSPVRHRKGIYRSYTFGPKGKRVKFILLDTRSFKEDPGKENSLLGEDQWQWLTRELNSKSAELFIIASSINVSSPVNFRNLLEGWNQYRDEKKRLYSLLESIDTSVLILSGDRHSSDFSVLPLKREKKVIEFMSSGLTHTRFSIPNPYRTGRAYSKPNFGVVKFNWKENKLRLEIYNSKENSLERELETIL